MKYENPPNFEAICAVFPAVRDHKGAIFTYGDFIYAPHLAPGTELAGHLNVHEQVHMCQQKEIGGPEVWWDRYLTDVDFRLEQEVEAYRAQYQFVLNLYSPKNEGLKRFLFDLACDLSGPLYGNMIDYGGAEIKIKRK